MDCMFRRMKLARDCREAGFTKVEVRGCMRRYDAGDLAGLKAFWIECWHAAQARKAGQGKSKWLCPDAYLNAG
jgi:hypothetical protein